MDELWGCVASSNVGLIRQYYNTLLPRHYPDFKFTELGHYYRAVPMRLCLLEPDTLDVWVWEFSQILAAPFREARADDPKWKSSEFLSYSIGSRTVPRNPVGFVLTSRLCLLTENNTPAARV